jgi:hypothetical protein
VTVTSLLFHPRNEKMRSKPKKMKPRSLLKRTTTTITRGMPPSKKQFTGKPKKMLLPKPPQSARSQDEVEGISFPDGLFQQGEAEILGGTKDENEIGPILPLSLDNWIRSVLSGDEPGVPPPYKQHPYLRPSDGIDELEKVFTSLSRPIPRGGLTALSVNLNPPFSTIQDWSPAIRENPDWRPTRRAYADAQRAFTDVEEGELLNRITTSLLVPGFHFNDADCQQEAMEYLRVVLEWLQGRVQTDPAAASRLEALHDLKASRRFVQGFHKRHAMSLRRPWISG